MGNTTAYDTSREGVESYITDGVNFEQLMGDEVAHVHYFHVVIMPSVQRHRLLSLLEGGYIY